MTYLTEFFYDGRKLFISISLTLILLVSYFIYNIEIIPYKIFLLLFSRYAGELNAVAFLIFYYFIINYAISILIIGIYDFVRKKKGSNNA